MLIGLNLVYCIQDIITAAVSESDVTRLIATTAARTDEEWNNLIEAYSQSFWRGNKTKACEVIGRLRVEGKIEQPRLTNQKVPRNGYRSRWVKSEEEILWMKFHQ